MENNRKQGLNKGKWIEAWWKNLERGKWKKGQSWNPRGRPAKSFTAIAKQLQEEWYSHVNKDAIREACELFIGLDEERIKSLGADESQPMMLRIMAKRMLSSKGFEMVERILDRVHGKAGTPISVEQPFTLADFLKGNYTPKKQRDEI